MIICKKDLSRTPCALLYSSYELFLLFSAWCNSMVTARFQSLVEATALSSVDKLTMIDVLTLQCTILIWVPVH